jgi:hypothetical protein
MKSKTPPVAECFAHHHMTVQEFGFWNYARSVSHERKVLFFDGRKIAARFEGTSKSTCYRLLKKLEAKGWCVCLVPTKKNKHGMWTATQWRFLDHEEWAAKHKNQCGTARPVPPAVVDSQKSSPSHATVQSQPCNQPVPQVGHNLIEKHTDMNNTDNNTYNLSSPIGGTGQSGTFFVREPSDNSGAIPRHVPAPRQRASVPAATNNNLNINNRIQNCEQNNREPKEQETTDMNTQPKKRTMAQLTKWANDLNEIWKDLPNPKTTSVEELLASGRYELIAEPTAQSGANSTNGGPCLVMNS